MGEHAESSVLGYLIPLYPPLIARKAVKWFTGGGLSPKTLAAEAPASGNSSGSRSTTPGKPSSPISKTRA
jgi:hypothetical protein